MIWHLWFHTSHRLCWTMHPSSFIPVVSWKNLRGAPNLPLGTTPCNLRQLGRPSHSSRDKSVCLFCANAGHSRKVWGIVSRELDAQHAQFGEMSSQRALLEFKSRAPQMIHLILYRSSPENCFWSSRVAARSTPPCAPAKSWRR